MAYAQATPTQGPAGGMHLSSVSESKPSTAVADSLDYALLGTGYSAGSAQMEQNQNQWQLTTTELGLGARCSDADVTMENVPFWVR